MKFLCLHGIGTNADILESQTAGIRSCLPEENEYIFVDGQFDADAAPGIGEFYGGPYYAHIEEPYKKTIPQAYEFIQDMIEEEGPFDGIIGFSQGACVAASYILQQNKEKSWEPSPFPIAVLICPVFPEPCYNHHLGLPTDVPTSQEVLTGAAAALEEIPTEESDSASDSDGELSSSASELSLTDSNSSSSYETDVSTPDSTDAGDNKELWESAPRIEVPTAFITGAQDPLQKEGFRMLDFIQKDMVMKYDHKGGHDIPRSHAVSEKIADMITTLNERRLAACS